MALAESHKAVSAKFKNLFVFLDKNILGDHVVVACSGGPDSMCLLHVLKLYQAQNPRLRLLVCHVNHGLGSQADDMQQAVVQYCLANDLSCVVETLVDFAYQDHGREGAWREARYAALAKHMQAGSTVVTGHTQDDQVETFFLNLMRGSGVMGLSAMPVSRSFDFGSLLRPLLGWSRQDVMEVCEAEDLIYVMDLSNDDLTLARNHLRQLVLPVLQSRYPGMRNSVVRSARYCETASNLCAELAEIDWGVCELNEAVVSVVPLRHLSVIRQVNALRYWLSKHVDYLPGEARLLNFLTQFLAASSSSVPCCDWGGWQLRYCKDHILLETPVVDQVYEMAWSSIADQIDLPAGLGQLSFIEGSGVSLAGLWTVRSRRGGETMRVRGCRRSLKSLFQELGVPAWQRRYIPLVCRDGELVAIADICYSDGLLSAGEAPHQLMIWSGGLADCLHCFLVMSQERG